MNIWENTVITAKGIALLAKLIKGHTLNITGARSGAGYVTPGTLQNQTTVTNPKQALRFRPASYPAQGKSEVTCYLTNDGLAAGYTASQIGVYADDPDEGEILFFITQATSGTGTIVPSETESPGFTAEWKFTVPYGQADGVNVTVDPSNTVTLDLMETYVAEATGQFWPTKVKTGTVMAINDSAALPFVGLSLYGKSKQVATTGKNLLPNTAVTQTVSGVKFTKNEDGSVTANGKSTATSPIRYTIGEADLPAGNYFVTGQSTGASSSFIMYSDQDGNFLNQHSGQDAPLTLTESATISVHLVIFEAATANVKVYPMIRKATVADAAYEPYTGGVPAPSPEQPQEIENLAEDGTIIVRVFGKNLIESLDTEKTVSGVTFKPNGDGGIVATGTATASAAVTLEYKTPPPGVYILSGGTANIRVVSRLTYKDGSPDTYITSYNGISREVTITEDVLGHSAYIEVRNGVTVAGEVIYPMLRAASFTDDTYEEYTMQEISISTPNGLPGIPVSSRGNYTDNDGQQWICDEVDLARGVYVQRIKVAKFVGNSNEGWNRDYTADDSKRRMVTSIYADVVKKTQNNQVANILCDLFVKARADDTYSLKERISVDDLGRIHIYHEAHSNSVDDWLEFLASTPMTVFLELASPVETALTDEWAGLTGNTPNTTIMTTDGGAEMKAQYVTAAFEAITRDILKRTAPAGFGLGGDVTVVDAAKLDEIVLPGWYDIVGDIYIGDDLYVGAPMAVDSNNRITTQTLSLGAYVYDAGYIVKRHKLGEKWTPWEWENPPMVPGKEYRTTERHNWLPVYKKIVNIGALPNTSSKSVSSGLNSKCTLLSVEAYAQAISTTVVQSIPFVSSTGTVLCKVHASIAEVTAYTFSDLSSEYTAYAVLRYTKS